MLDGLMRRAVFTEADRIMREHINDGSMHDRRYSQRRSHVIGEYKERGAERPQSAERQAVADRGHAVLADAGGKMLPNLVGDEEFFVLRPAIELLGELDLVLAKGSAVSRVCIGLVRRAIADDAFEDDDRGLIGLFFRRVDRPLNGTEIVG